MPEKYFGEISSEQPEKKGIESLHSLAMRFQSEGIIIDGVDAEARENNRQVVEAIKAAGVALASRKNDFYCLRMGGSRIQGANTMESDIDVVSIMPDTTDNSAFIDEVVKKELQKRGISNKLDPGMAMFRGFEVETDPEKFLEQVQHPEDGISLFGYEPYKNANMDLTRLAALEIIQGYDPADYDWQFYQREYTHSYLGERRHLVGKLAVRYGVSETEAKKMFTTDLFRERYVKFGLRSPIEIYGELKQWYDENKDNLRAYRMYETYNDVLKLLEERDY